MQRAVVMGLLADAPAADKRAFATPAQIMTAGSAPPARVTLKAGAAVIKADLIEHCGKRLARLKALRTAVSWKLSKTSTGKVQRDLLRQRAQALGPTRIPAECGYGRDRNRLARP